MIKYPRSAGRFIAAFWALAKKNRVMSTCQWNNRHYISTRPKVFFILKVSFFPQRDLYQALKIASIFSGDVIEIFYLHAYFLGKKNFFFPLKAITYMRKSKRIFYNFRSGSLNKT